MKLNVKRKPDANCEKCGLYKTCQTPIMPGDGSENPIFEFVAEAPGADEDDPKNGKPLVGSAGKLLKQAIEDCGISIDDCRFTNVVKCRPPSNDLKKYPKAVELCKPKILRELHVTKPKVVIILGAVALKSLLGKIGISKLHGETFEDKEHNRTYVVCLHPSFILRNLTDPMLRKFREAISLAASIGGVKAKRHKSDEVKKTKTITITDKKMLYECTDFLRSRSRLASDIEGSTLSAFQKSPKPELGCVGFSPEFGYAIMYPIFARVGWERKIKIKPEEMLEAVKDIWTDKKIKHSLHFGKYDEGYVDTLHGFKIANYYHDTGLLSYAYNIQKGIHGLKDWMLRLGGDAYWDRRKREYLRAYKEANPEQGGNHNFIPGDILYPYCGEDCSYTRRLDDYLTPLVKEMGRYERPFKFPIMYLNQVAEYLEQNGLALDMEKNNELLEEFPKRINALDRKTMEFKEYHILSNIKKRMLMQDCYERASSYKKPPPNIKKKTIELYNLELEKLKAKGEDIVKLNADADKRILLFDILDMEILEKTPTGLPSVKAELLAKMGGRKKPPILTIMIKRAEYKSGESKYVKPLQTWVGTDGRTHSSYLIHGQVTGRVSSENPNHENLIKRGDKWVVSNIQEQFIANPESEDYEDGDYALAKADLKQNELRLLADRAQDKVLIAEFNAGKDPHGMAAQAGYNLTEKQWNQLDEHDRHEKRSKAKQAVSFGLVYGGHEKALSADMGWSLARGKKFKDAYFNKYWGIAEYLVSQREVLMEKKYAESYFGRIRPLPEIDSDEFYTVERAMREGINAPPQGDSSDMAWTAAYRMMNWLRRHKMKTKLVIIEHDGIYADTHRKEMSDVFHKLEYYMTNRDWWKKMTGWYCSVEFAVDIAIGRNLAKKIELKKEGDQWIIPSEFQ